MRRYLATVFCLLLLASWTATEANAQAAKAQTHAAAAKAAAYEPGQDFTLIYELCAEPRPGPPAAAPATAPFTARKIPPRAQWYTEATKVFDNLYYVGGSRQENTNMWAVTTSAGIILIDAGRDYTTEELIVNGLKKMGLDPAQIKYVIVTEGEFLFYGGAKLLQDRYKARVLLSEADWDVIARSNVPVQFKPRKDMVITDGQKLTLGDVTVTLYVTPGHTPGTVSLLISPLKDGNQRHVGSIFGGRAPAGDDVVEGVQYYRNEIDSIKTWSASAKRYKGIAESAGADVFLAVHDNWDKTLDKVNAVKFRKPGGPHPLVSKTAVSRFQTMISECMDAQLAWRASK
jgi:metallo-beta-lactamase class B